MWRLLRLVVIVACLGAGYQQALNAAFEYKVYTGRIVADELDPDRPGRIRGVVVTLPELLFHAGLALGCLGAAGILIYKTYRESRAK